MPRYRLSMRPESHKAGWAALAFLALSSAACVSPEQPKDGPEHNLGALVYARTCAACHDGGALQAPRREALALLPLARIEASLLSGVMQAQGLALDANERRAVAKYLARDNTAQSAEKGQCPTSETARLSPVKVADWGMTPENTRAAGPDATTINASNVGRLKLAWAFGFPDGSRARVQPTLAGDVLFTADQNGTIYALDAGAGCVRWSVETPHEIRSSLVIGASPSGEATTLYFADIAGRVHALDIASRKLLWSATLDQHPHVTVTGTLRLFEGVLFVPVSSTEVVAAMDGKYACCTFRGAVAALDAATGATIWKTHTIDESPVTRGRNREGAEMFGPSGAPVWSTPTIDAERRLLYIGTGENYSHPASDKSDAILALEMATGRVVWRYQALSGDVWNAACSQGANCPVATGPDYDFGAPPILAKTSTGRSVLLAGQKSGIIYALDPDNSGNVLWTAKPGRGGIMGGVHWGMTSGGGVLYAPISDLSVYPRDAHLPAQSGIHAFDIATGLKLWANVLPDRCGQTSWRCSPGISAAATLAPGVVFGGSLDGMLRAFSADDGSVLWAFDTNRSFEAVNGVNAFGGGIDSSGPVVAGDFVFATSGYDKFGQKPGNLLLAFKIDGQAPAGGH